MERDRATRPSLLLRVRDAGDDAAWRQFTDIYTPLILGFCRGRGLAEPDAADVTQEVLKAVALALPRFEYDRDRSSFRNWLFTVVRSKVASHFAAQARRPLPAGDSTLQEFGEQAADAGDEAAWQREYQAHVVRWAAEQIRAEFKGPTWDGFWRTAVLGEDAERVAGDLGLTLNALYIARSRVTGRLRRKVEELGDTPDLIEIAGPSPLGGPAARS